MKVAGVLMVITCSMLIGSCVSGATSRKALPEQDPELIRFVERALPWYPGSSFSISSDERAFAPAGAYRLVNVERSCASQLLSGSVSVLIDEVTKTSWIGSVADVPLGGTGVAPDALKSFLNGFLPEAMERNQRRKVRLDWESTTLKLGALIPFDMVVDTGYGEYRKAAAVSADGAKLVLGAHYPMETDPVAYRTALLKSSDVVILDHPVKSAKVRIIEFSDLECPACRMKWPLIEDILGDFPGAVEHGMVGLPLLAIHPWAFRASSATWCVAEQDPLQTLPFKKLFYSLQSEMELSEVTPTALDFVAGAGLDEEAFRDCYLKDRSLTAVHKQLELGESLNIMSTPTYVINGWMVVVADEAWLPDMVQRLIKGQEP
jgi:protein-disulfide isomerase